MRNFFSWNMKRVVGYLIVSALVIGGVGVYVNMHAHQPEKEQMIKEALGDIKALINRVKGDVQESRSFGDDEKAVRPDAPVQGDASYPIVPFGTDILEEIRCCLCSLRNLVDSRLDILESNLEECCSNLDSLLEVVDSKIDIVDSKVDVVDVNLGSMDDILTDTDPNSIFDVNATDTLSVMQWLKTLYIKVQ